MLPSKNDKRHLINLPLLNEHLSSPIPADVFAIITASQISWGALAPSISAPGQGITIKGSFSIFQMQLKWGERGHHLNTQSDVR